MSNEKPAEPEMIHAPWDEKTVRNLNQFQMLPWVHPFTCGNVAHARAPRLVAMTAGWRCPDPHEDDCEYRQTWAHAAMADPNRWPHGPAPWYAAMARATAALTDTCNGEDPACGRLNCDACRTGYLDRLTKAVSSTGGQVLAGLKDVARRFAQSEAWLPTMEMSDVTKPAVRWCCNGNAENCVLCTREITDKLPYPWICPGHSPTEAAVAAVRRADPDDEDEAEEEANQRLRDAVVRLRETVNQGEQDEDLDADALRALVSREVLAKAIERIEREWICCDPVATGHDLCMQGQKAINMVTAVLTDNPDVFPPRSDTLDVIMRFVLGASDPRERGTILTKTELREIYFKAIKRGYDRVNAGAGLETIHALVDEVIHARDRELVRNRQRLQLSDHAHRMALLAEMGPAVNLGAERNKARLEERVKVLDEIHALLHRECASPIEQLTFRNPLIWIRGERERAQKALDERSHD